MTDEKMTDEELRELIEQDKDAQREGGCGACACPLRSEGACPAKRDSGCGGCTPEGGEAGGKRK